MPMNVPSLSKVSSCHPAGKRHDSNMKQIIWEDDDGSVVKYANLIDQRDAR